MAGVEALRRRVTGAIDAHPFLRVLVQNIARDNINVLAGFVSWSILTSLVPLTVGVVGIYGLFVQSPDSQAALIQHLSQLFQGAVTTHDIETGVKALSRNSGLVGLIAAAGVLWGASNIGGSFATAFRLIFDTKPRPFIQEKLLDVGMIFVFTGLMAVILLSTTAVAFLDKLGSTLPFPAPSDVVIATFISLVSAFVLFSAIYTLFPNIQSGYKLRHVWRGALLAAILFQIVTTIWPIYVRASHASRYGAVLFSIVILTAWIYCFSLILMVGAEVIAARWMRDEQKEGTVPTAAG